MALRADADRSAQRVDDLEDEVTRLRQIRNAVVKPTHQLWIGLTVLAYPAIVGIIMPVISMAAGVEAITTYVHILVGLFISGFLVLLAYLAYFAGRLFHRRKTAS
ncbi:MAG: hypothetical protein GEU97_15865 [Actinophytocola sp.]|nr:hypothetical protein [Actinophytocola sp.]